MTHRIIEYQLPATTSLQKLHGDIHSRFSCHSESMVGIERSYQDSFDGRLYKRGYEYYVEKDGNLRTLFIHPVNAFSQLHMLAVSEVPVFAQDFRSIVFYRLMAPVLGIRALMPHIVLSIKRRVLTLVDTEHKKYAQMQLDEVSLDQSPVKHTSLGNVLRLLPVKGYEPKTDELIAFLEGHLGLERCDETQLTRALKITGSAYCPMRLVPHPDLRADMRTDEAAKAILLSELDIMEFNEAGISRNIDSEFLHDYRVAVRRSRSILKHLKGVFPKRIVDRYNTAFSRLGRLSSPLRDVQVYLLKFDYYQQQLPDGIKSHLEPLKAFLLNQEKIEHAKLVHELGKKPYISMKQHWRQFLQQPVPDKVVLPNATRRVKQVADTVIWNSFLKVIAYGNKIGDDSADEKLHRMRIYCKKLRYLLEFFSDIYPPKAMSVNIKSLKKLQNMLGDFQDLSVQVAALRFYESRMREEGLLTEQTLDAMELLIVHLQAMKQTTRMQFVDCYADLSSAKTEKRFVKLFNSGSRIP